MTSTLSKKWIGISLGVFAFFGMLILFLNLPFVSYAQSGTLGTEKPYVYCTYYKDGAQVDGNSLEAGTYNVNFELSGMENISVVEITASYSDIASVDPTPVAVMSDSVGDVSSMGYVIGEGNMVFGFVSDNDDTSAVSSDSVTLATVAVTFSESCDAADVITVSDNPNLTFAQADYADGYDDEYAITTVDPDYNGSLYTMTCDVTPDMNREVSGSIVVATKPDGTTANKAAYGEYTLTVYSDSEKSQQVAQVQSVYSGPDKPANTFSVALADGTYYATLTYDYSITRDDITIKVNGSDISGAVIPVIACDFNSDGRITSVDTNECMKFAGSISSAPYGDLDASGNVTSVDTNITMTCGSKSLSCPAVTIE